MAKAERKEPIEVISPRYAGATPKDVALALFKHPPKTAPRHRERKEQEAVED